MRITLVGILIVATSTAPASSQLLAELSETQIRSAWEEYLAVPSAAYGESVNISTDKTADQIASTSNMTFWRSDEGELVETATKYPSSDGPAAYAHGRNSEYSFRLEKADAGDEWTLQDVSRLNVLDDQAPPPSHGPLLKIGAAGRLDQLIDHENVEIVSIENSGDLVILRLAGRASRSGTEAMADIASATLTLDPTAMFVIKSAAIEGAPEARFRTIQLTNEYDVIEGYPNPKSSTLLTQYDDMLAEVATNVSIWDHNRNVPDSRFTLTSYGLPEPPETNAPGSYRTPAWLYYFIGGVLCVAVGAFAVHWALKDRTRA